MSKKKKTPDTAPVQGNEPEITEEKAPETPKYTLDIPEDEIWTYQIEGLQAPHINKGFDNAVTKKVITVVVLVVAISLSIFFSVRAVHTDEYDYKITDEYCELVKYSNPGEVTEVTIDKANDENGTPVTIIHEYAFNCDAKITTINIGPSVTEIDGKSFYSCWSLEAIHVDENNPAYCDVDGVLYNKEMTEVICYPCNHNTWLAKEYGVCEINFPDNNSYTYDSFTDAVKVLDDALRKGDFSDLDENNSNLRGLKQYCGVTDFETFIKAYNEKVGYYVVPSTVTKIGKLAFAYCDLTAVYLPEGLKEIETMGFFKSYSLADIRSYTTDGTVTSSVYADSAAGMNTVYASLPEGLEIIGSDAFSYDNLLSYMYIPASVTSIGHHAFWDTVKKDGDSFIGIGVMNVAAEESDFHKSVETGNDWKPKYKSGLFKKTVNTDYSAARTAIE